MKTVTQKTSLLVARFILLLALIFVACCDNYAQASLPKDAPPIDGKCTPPKEKEADIISCPMPPTTSTLNYPYLNIRDELVFECPSYAFGCIAQMVIIISDEISSLKKQDKKKVTPSAAGNIMKLPGESVECRDSQNKACLGYMLDILRRHLEIQQAPNKVNRPGLNSV